MTSITPSNNCNCNAFSSKKLDEQTVLVRFLEGYMCDTLDSFKNEIFEKINDHEKKMKNFIRNVKRDIKKAVSFKQNESLQSKKSIHFLNDQNYGLKVLDNNICDDISYYSDNEKEIEDESLNKNYSNASHISNDQSTSLEMINKDTNKRLSRDAPLKVIEDDKPKDLELQQCSLEGNITTGDNVLKKETDLRVNFQLLRQLNDNITKILNLKIFYQVPGSKTDIGSLGSVEVSNNNEVAETSCKEVINEVDTEVMDEKKTGTKKKVLSNGLKKNSLQAHAKDIQTVESEELGEILKDLASILDVKYEKATIKVHCKPNNIVIFFQHEEELERWLKAAKQKWEKSKFSYKELLELEDVDVILNTEKFECPVCYTEVGVGEGIVLRDCLHLFCRNCIENTVKHNTEMEVLCPYADNDYVCSGVIQHREIKQIVSKEIYEHYLDRTFTIVGNKLSNTLHCNIPDCKYFYICEEEISEFSCQKCGQINCVPCQAVHTGMNCKEYQTELKYLSETDHNARETLKTFEAMIASKEAMNCPGCSVVIMKLEGCDWMQCLMCKTEICWATLGPRWGPEGRGDTTGGCRCRANGGPPCHINCRNCH
ncbi:uncharacterized protein LOC142329417 [Lycorma delicatula]|uniref:uncharacterized protein LOC142329417 n=1 Tax=Lycorma delicatula TaxID=130591 RepID=UPI003F513EA7